MQILGSNHSCSQTLAIHTSTEHDVRQKPSHKQSPHLTTLNIDLLHLVPLVRPVDSPDSLTLFTWPRQQSTS